MPKISLIVPVYNACLYLRRSVESLLAQTFSDFELILVDDGSTDGSAALCDAFAADDSRIRVLRKSNGGASSARNSGMDVAVGEWIVFADADDYVSPRYLEVMERECDGADVVMQGMTRVDISGNMELWKLGDIVTEYDLSKDGDGERFLADVPNLSCFGGPYCKMYRREVIVRHHLAMNTGIIFAEDFEFFLRFLLVAPRIKTVPAYDCYHYEVNSGSVTQKLIPFEKEYNTFSFLPAAINGFAGKYHISTDDKIFINCCLWHYCARLFASVYSRRSDSRRRSVEILRNLSQEDISIIKRYWRPHLVAARWAMWLLERKKFKLSDIILKVIYIYDVVIVKLFPDKKM